ncbi:MAG TPA: hypothetical protein PLW98_04900 [Bacillota bacterium]|nr:hypothetical protein [Bacillota bacterium]
MNMTVTESIQRIRGLSLIGSPLFFLISELLHPVTQDEAVKELQSVASNHTQWYLAHMAALFAIILLPYAIQGLLVLIGEHSLILSRTAAGLISVGTVAVSGLLAFDLITWVMAINGSREEMIRLYDAITQSPGFSLPFLVIGPLILVIGILMLAVVLYRSGAVKRWQALCLGTGIFLYGFAGPVFPVSNGPLIVISGAVLMLISLGYIGIKLLVTGR